MDSTACLSEPSTPVRRGQSENFPAAGATTLVGAFTDISEAYESEPPFDLLNDQARAHELISGVIADFDRDGGDEVMLVPSYLPFFRGKRRSAVYRYDLPGRRLARAPL